VWDKFLSGILENGLRAELERLGQDGLRRSLRVIESAQAGRVTYDGRSVIMLSSNNYLGLAAHPRVKQAAVAATDRYGVGSGASRLVATKLFFLISRWFQIPSGTPTKSRFFGGLSRQERRDWAAGYEQ
jgi:hypothetical protein